LNALDYYNNPEITSYIGQVMAHIKNKEDREDCRQEIFAELYDFMPLDVAESRLLIKRIAMKFARSVAKIAENEVSLSDARIND
jgi:hypothetical protein